MRMFNFIPNMNYFDNLNVMKMDRTTENILDNLTAETNQKFNTNLTREDIKRIVESQYKLVPVAIQYGDEIRLPTIGRIGIRNTRQKYMSGDDLSLIHEMQEVKRTGGVGHEIGY